MNCLYKFFGGRHTFFAIWFAITAFVLALRGELTHVYVEIVVALQAYVLLHSAKEDYATKKGVVDPKTLPPPPPMDPQ